VQATNKEHLAGSTPVMKQRNKLIHESTSCIQETKVFKRLSSRVYKCFKYRDSMKVADREKIFMPQQNKYCKETHDLSKHGSEWQSGSSKQQRERTTVQQMQGSF
jgi:hypothetical protein